MLGSNILDVAIGLVLVFLLVSLLASAVREAIESSMTSRAVYLERGIRELLGDSRGDGMAQAFYKHPLIYSLFRDEYVYRRKRRTGQGLPTYIPAKNFAIALLDLTVRGSVRPEYAAMQTMPEELTAQNLRNNITKLKNPALQRAVLTAIDYSGGDREKIRQNLQDWFDSSMDRVSGWYKRSTHRWLFGIGFVLAVTLNINPIQIGNVLWRDKTLREALVTRGEALARDTVYQRMLRDTTLREADVQRVKTDLAELNLPVGWSKNAWENAMGASGDSPGNLILYWPFALLGWIMTGLAVTLGAPFWFDALNKFMVIRSTVKPHEKSPEESSEDRQKDKKLDTASGDAQPKGGAGESAAASPPPSPPTGTQRAGESARTTDEEPGFVKLAWDTQLSGKTSDDEGVL